MTAPEENGYRRNLKNLTDPDHLTWILCHETANEHSKRIIEAYNSPETIQPESLTVGEYAKKYLKK